MKINIEIEEADCLVDFVKAIQSMAETAREFVTCACSVDAKGGVAQHPEITINGISLGTGEDDAL